MAYTITVNGARRTVDVEAETPLLWVLRDELGLKGTKFGCGMSFCGACTVHLNGKPTRSCITPISSVGDAAITTIEGIDASEVGPPSSRRRVCPLPIPERCDHGSRQPRPAWI